MKTPRTLLAAAAAALLATSACASTGGSGDGGDGSDFPDGVSSIQIVVPFNAGGSTDTVARLVAPRLSEELGVTVQVLNKPEGNGQTGLNEVSTGPTDGSVLGSTNLPSAIISYLDPNTDVSYDQDSFTPVGGIAAYGELIVVSADSPYSTLDDLIEAADAGQVNLAAGAVDDLLPVSTFEDEAGVTFNKVPFEGGSAGKVPALLGNKVDVITAAPSAVLPNVASGEFRVLATLGGERAPSFPDVETVAELGYDIAQDVVLGFSLPEGTPAAIAEAYADALQTIAEDPEFVEAVEGVGFGVVYLSPEDFAEQWSQQEDVARPIIESIG
ncbi:MAG: tripartite tricarboxylate transporter substrate binding protein [Aeromicrobium sp.]|uniref:tripartite tricarboxylate transporter substrate binding protein n=1 Tax=Aeromicrobium sp. TaxID=1871063 RepID=UPI00262397E8|nr:tripartite tricarboxylate transporter substrate binding protein [Aeromicrobium sp.]MDF1705324.1 tripartite tricarboxylate transporter substrate binding protein [Aeromicrobium sp.]